MPVALFLMQEAPTPTERLLPLHPQTLTAMVVGIYPEGMQPGACNVAVEDLGEYLKNQNI